MPAFESAASPSDAHMSAPATPLIEWADSAEPQTTVPENLVPGFEEIAIGRMLTGAAPAVAVTHTCSNDTKSGHYGGYLEKR